VGEDLNTLPSQWDELVPSWTAFHNRVRIVGAEVAERYPNGDPLLLHHTIDNGDVWFYTGEWLTSAGDQNPRQILRGLLEKARMVELNPPTDQIQSFVHTRDGIAIVALLNHGQAGFPQGFGPKTGSWAGTVTIRTTGLGLVPQKLEVLGLDEEHASHQLEFTREDDRLSIRLDIDELAQLAIGPEGDTKQILFGSD